MKKILGIPIIVIILSLMVVGGGIVTTFMLFLPDSTTKVIDASSTTKFELDSKLAPELGGTWEKTQYFGTVYGGDTVAWRTQIVNNADMIVDGTVIILILNEENYVSCNNFKSIELYDQEQGIWVDLSTTCSINSEGQAIVNMPIKNNGLETKNYLSKIIFNEKIKPMEYYITTQIMA